MENVECFVQSILDWNFKTVIYVEITRIMFTCTTVYLTNFEYAERDRLKQNKKMLNKC